MKNILILLMLLCAVVACSDPTQHSLLAVKAVSGQENKCITQDNVTITCFDCGGIGAQWEYCTLKETLNGQVNCYCD